MKKVKRKIPIVMASVLIVGTLLLLLVITPSVIGTPLLPEENEPTNVVRVEVGDWAKYSVRGTGPRSHWSLYGSLEGGNGEREWWFKIEVQNISATQVTILRTNHFADGEEVNKTISGDLIKWVDDQTYYYDSIEWERFIIAADLSVGDKVYLNRLVVVNVTSDGSGDLVRIETLPINSTVSRSYGEATREVNLLKWSYLKPFAWNIYNHTEEYCWDKETGLLLELTWQTYALGYENTSISALHIEIFDTNLWEMSEGSSPWTTQAYLWIATAVGTVAIIFSVGFKKRHVIRKLLKNERD